MSLQAKVKYKTDCELYANTKYNGDAGFDLYIQEDLNLSAGQSKVVGTGVKVEIPLGYVGLVFPRSSTGKQGFALANTAGVIDASYRGEVLLAVRPTANIHFSAGAKVAQLVVVPCLTSFIQCDELSDTERGENGFGSTGA